MEETVKLQGKSVPLGRTFEWNGHKLKIFREIFDKKFGRVLIIALDYVKGYIVEDTVATDREIIDYLDDHYGLPTKYRNIVF